MKIEYKCPQSSVPSGCIEWTRNVESLPSTTLSFDVVQLDPYTKHHVTVTVHNEAGSMTAETLEQTTLSAGQYFYFL